MHLTPWYRFDHWQPQNWARLLWKKKLEKFDQAFFKTPFTANRELTDIHFATKSCSDEAAGVSFASRKLVNSTFAVEWRKSDAKQRPRKHAVITAISYERAISRGVVPLPKIRGFMPVCTANAALPATDARHGDVEVRHPNTPARNGSARNRRALWWCEQRRGQAFTSIS